jgi:hypothetical protein
MCGDSGPKSGQDRSVQVQKTSPDPSLSARLPGARDRIMSPASTARATTFAWSSMSSRPARAAGSRRRRSSRRNALGRAYLAAIKPFHRLVLRSMIAQADRWSELATGPDEADRSNPRCTVRTNAGVLTWRLGSLISDGVWRRRIDGGA